jgi:hypothetical protein
MNTTTAGTPALSAAAAALATCALVWPVTATADNPCMQPSANVQRLVTDLNRVSAGHREPGLFQVKRLSLEGSPGRFEATYVVAGRTIFTGRFQQRDEVSDHLAVRVARGAPGTLEVGYGFGAGGKVSCDYKILKAGDRFVASKTR